MRARACYRSILNWYQGEKKKVFGGTSEQPCVCVQLIRIEYISRGAVVLWLPYMAVFVNEMRAKNGREGACLEYARFFRRV